MPIPTTNEEVIFAIDTSWSTANSKFYIDSIERIVSNTIRRPTKYSRYTVIHWNTTSTTKRCRIDNVVLEAKEIRSQGGTDIGCFIDKLKSGIDLVIISDGQVPGNSVSNARDTLSSKNLTFSRVEVHYIETGGRINLSVAAPFIRNTDYKVYNGNRLISNGSSTENIDFQIYHNELDKFLQDSDSIISKLAVQNLGASENKELKTQILKLQKNLLGVIRRRETNDAIAESVRSSETVDEAKDKLWAEINKEPDEVVSKVDIMFKTLIHIADGKLGFEFDSLDPSRLMNAQRVSTAMAMNEIEPVNVDDVEDTATASTAIDRNVLECPILCEDDHMMILVRSGDQNILGSLDKEALDMIISNPLMFLKHKALVSRFSKSLDSVVGLKAVKQIHARSADSRMFESPTTRQPINAVISPYCEETHIRATRSAFSKLLFGDKFLGNIDIWLVVLYHIILQTSVEPIKYIIPLFEKFLIRRLRTSTTAMTLSGLPIQPLKQTNVDVAIWYCVHSYLFFEDNDARNRLRSGLGSTALYLIPIIKLLGLPVDEEAIRHRLRIYNAFTWMMKEAKDSMQKMRGLIRAQYQNSTFVGNDYVFLDGEVTNVICLPPDFDGLGLGELIALSKLVDVRKTSGTVTIPHVVVPSEIPRAKTNYVYPNIFVEDRHMPVLSGKTFRPMTYDPRTTRHWEDEDRICNGDDPYKRITLYKYFIDYVTDRGEYPTKDKFVLYLSARQANREDRPVDTLPRHIFAFVDDLFANYESILGENFRDVSSDDFIKTTKGSRNREKRLEMER